MIVTYPSPIARKTLDSEIKRGQSRHHAMGENFLDERFCGGGTSDGSRRRSPTPEPPPEREIIRPTLLRDFAVGLRAGFGHRLVRPILLVEGNVAFFDGFFFALYLIFTIDTLGLSPGVVGVLIGMGGIGALMGALIARRVPSFLGLRLAMIRLAGLAQAAQLLIPLARGPDWMVPSFLATHHLIGDAVMVAYVLLAVSLRQTVLPLGVLGRANATLQVLTRLLLPAGALIAGWLATALDVRTAIWIGVLGGLLAPMILALSPIRSLRRMPVPG